MAADVELRDSGERIEQLLTELRSTVSSTSWERIDELIRCVVHLYGAGLAHIVTALDAAGDDGAERVRERLLADELVSGLMILHGLHPQDLTTRVQAALEQVRPYLGSHGGNVELIDIDANQGRARLRLTGSCDGCPSSLLTVKLAVEGAIQNAAPEIMHVEVEGVSDGNRRSPAVQHPTVEPTAGAPASDGDGPTWIHLSPLPDLSCQPLAAEEVNGTRIVFCQLGEQLYAYRDECPACRAAMARAAIDGDVLSCPSCGHRYNARMAGRSLQRNDLSLVPVPLLREQDGVRIALMETHA